MFNSDVHICIIQGSQKLVYNKNNYLNQRILPKKKIKRVLYCSRKNYINNGINHIRRIVHQYK